MKKNQSSYNIDQQLDAIQIGLNIYNNTSYDIFNKRDTTTKAIVEIELTNVSENSIEIYSPHLSIESKNVITRYCSKALLKQYPIELKPLNAVKIPFDSENFHHLLSQQTDEIIRIFVTDNFNKVYSSVNIEGDVLEDVIEDKNIVAIFQAKTIYKFDTIVSTKNIDLPEIMHPTQKTFKNEPIKSGFLKKLKSLFIID